MTERDGEKGVRRALVIASQTGGLTGCDNDADLVAGLLDDRGFEISSLHGPAASRAGILAGFERLIEACGPADTAVIYYAGHGSRAIAQEPVRPTELRFILPTDIHETSLHDFRGILADELSILQWRLSQRTANVTTVLDSCFSARMSRDSVTGSLRVRGWDADWPVDAVVRRWQAAADDFARLGEAHPDSIRYDANPSAVRMVACSSHQRSYEGYSAELGAVHGFFTAALVSALRADPDSSWQAINERVRHQVLAQVPVQRPEAEGPVRRIPFSLIERDHGPAYPVRVDPTTGLAWLDAARLHSITQGDEFLLARAGLRPDAAASAVASVTALSGQAALLRRSDGEPIAAGTTAHAWRKHTHDQLPVVLRADDGLPVPAAFRNALSELPGLRVSEAPAPGAIATIAVADGHFQLCDGASRPLYQSPRPTDQGTASRLRRELIGLATSLRLRSLDLTGDTEFSSALSLVVTCGDVPVIDDSVLHVGDVIHIQVGNDQSAASTVYANVLDLGVAGRVSMLNTAEPAGMALLPGESRVIGAGPDGRQAGIVASWPPGVPDDQPRFETVIAVFCDQNLDLRSLDQQGVTERDSSDPFARLLRSGFRDLPAPDGEGRFALRRVTFVLCPSAHGPEGHQVG